MDINVASVHEKKKLLKCDVCDYSCNHKGNMRQHVLLVHEANEAI